MWKGHELCAIMQMDLVFTPLGVYCHTGPEPNRSYTLVSKILNVASTSPWQNGSNDAC